MSTIPADIIPRGLDGIGMLGGVASVGSQTRPEDIPALSLHPAVRAIVLDFDPPEATVAAIESHILSKRPEIAIIFAGRDDKPWPLHYLRLLPSHRRLHLHYSGSELPKQLAMLSGLPTLERFNISSAALRDLSLLKDIPVSIQDLTVGESSGKKRGLATLTQFRALRSLAMTGPVDDHSVLGQLRGLESLNIQSAALPNLQFLTTLSKLSWLRLALGSIHSMIGMEGHIALRYLEMWRTRGVSDLSLVGSLPQLRQLFLQDLSQVTIMPDLSQLQHLHSAHLQSLKRLERVDGLARAPKLVTFLYINAERAITLQRLQAFLEHPTLRGLCVLWRSDRARTRDFDRLVAAARKSSMPKEWDAFRPPPSVDPI